jgi:Tfp pilus assembly protein PilN
MLEVKQRIDLYLPRFQPAQLSREVKILFIAIASVFGIFLVTTIVLILMKSSLENDVVIKKQEQIELNEALARAISQIPNVTADLNLINRIAREKRVFKKNQKVIAYLYQNTINEGENFTGLVDQLAQQTVKNVWLDKFQVLNQGQDVQLFGYAKTPKQVSQYMKMLGAQPSYDGRNFQQIQIKKSDNGWNEFYISTLTQEAVLAMENPESGSDE